MMSKVVEVTGQPDQEVRGQQGSKQAHQSGKQCTVENNKVCKTEREDISIGLITSTQSAVVTADDKLPNHILNGGHR